MSMNSNIINTLMCCMMYTIMLPIDGTAQSRISEEEFQAVRSQITNQVRNWEQSHGLRNSTSGYLESLSGSKPTNSKSNSTSLPAVPSGLSPDFQLPAGTESKTSTSSTPARCPRLGWCYIIIYPDGRKEEQLNPTIDISYPPKDDSPRPRLIIVNMQ